MNDPDHLDDPQLDALLGDVVSDVQMQIERDGAMPDLAAVVAMAHRLDPRRVPASVVEEVADYAPVVPLREGRRLRQTRDDPAMEAIVAEVRAHVDQDVAARLHTPSSSAQPVSAANAPGPRRLWLTIAAAAAVLLVSTAGIVGAQRLIRDEPAGERSLVEQVHGPADAERARVRRSSEPSRPATTPVMPDPLPVPQVDEPEPEPEPARSRRRARRSATDAASLDERLAKLDAEAHAAWRAGDLATAERKFGRIVELGGTRRIADLAYGDLFTLARQAHRPGREARLWTAYLRRFPQGRFADDARAGTCRRAHGDTRRACWAAYLEASPNGAYRGQAKRELESGAP